MFRRSAPVSLIVLSLSASAAVAPESLRAQHEIERELHDTEESASIELEFDGIDSERYLLVDTKFELDGRPLTMALVKSSRRNLFSSKVAKGPHTLLAKMVYKQRPGSVFSYMDDYRFEVAGRISLRAESGLVLRIRARVHADERRQLTERLQFVAQLEPRLDAGWANRTSAVAQSLEQVPGVPPIPNRPPPSATPSLHRPLPHPVRHAELTSSASKKRRLSARLLESVRARLRRTDPP